MANNIALGLVIGGAVGASFNQALSDSTSKLQAFKKKAEETRGFHNLIGDTVALKNAMGAMQDKSSTAFSGLLRQHEQNIAKLKQHGLAVGNLEKEYARLGKAVAGANRITAGRESIGQGVDQLKSAGKIGAAVAATATAPVMVSAGYQAIVRDIAIKGNIAGRPEEAVMSEQIRVAAHETGMARNDLANAVNTLVAGGMNVAEAVSLAGTTAKFTIGQNSDATDTAKLVLALRQAGIADPKAIERSLGTVSAAGDKGSFEAKDMAKFFPSLMPQMTAFGLSGERATLELATMLQTQMRAAGSADEAANNLANLLAKLTSSDTVEKFKDQGIDIQGSLAKAVASGLDPVTAFIRIIQKTMEKNPEKAKKLAELQERISKAQDPAAAQNMLDKYLDMAGLSTFIVDRQAKQAALAALQNEKLHQANLKEIQSTDGVAKIEKDLADRRATSSQIWKEAGDALDESMARIGDAIRPLSDLAGKGVKAGADLISQVSKDLPGLAMGIVVIGGAIAATKAALGIWAIGKGVAGIAAGRMGMAAAGQIGATAGSAGMMAKLLPYGTKIGGGLAAVGAGYKVYDTAMNANTAEEKGAGYGGAAGSLAGGLAGAKAGALVGAFAGPIGAAIGGVVGGIGGAIGGDQLGAWAGKKIAGSGSGTGDTATAGPQQVSFSPSLSITVNGDVKDPKELAKELEPQIQRMLNQFMSTRRSSALYDANPS